MGAIMGKSSSFWTTFPGIIVAIAGVITALGILMTAIGQTKESVSTALYGDKVTNINPDTGAVLGVRRIHRSE
jgi:hypothetical protein